MELVDTHCHIQSIGSAKEGDHTKELWAKYRSSATEVIAAANNAGVVKLVCVGCDLDDSKLAVNFVTGRDNCYASVGVHPHEAKRYIGSDLKAELLSLVNEKKVVAIGECGLDYFYQHSDPDDQSDILRLQLDIAVQTNLPVIFHVRNAFTDFWPIFDSYNRKIRGVLHSFTDSIDTLHMAIDKGLYIGVNGIATFANDPNQLKMYRSIPSERLLFETDSPYLTPNPYRGTINEPKQIRTVAEFLSGLRGEGLTQLAKITTANAHLLFGI